jgi:hypothetical protein
MTGKAIPSPCYSLCNPNCSSYREFVQGEIMKKAGRTLDVSLLLLVLDVVTYQCGHIYLAQQEVSCAAGLQIVSL